MYYETVKKEAEAQGLSIRKLAAKANMTAPDLCQAISGAKTFWPQWRKRVSEALGVPEDQLFPKN